MAKVGEVVAGLGAGVLAIGGCYACVTRAVLPLVVANARQNMKKTIQDEMERGMSKRTGKRKQNKGDEEFYLPFNEKEKGFIDAIFDAYDKNKDLVLGKEEFEDLEDVLTQQMYTVENGLHSVEQRRISSGRGGRLKRVRTIVHEHDQPLVELLMEHIIRKAADDDCDGKTSKSEFRQIISYLMILLCNPKAINVWAAKQFDTEKLCTRDKFIEMLKNTSEIENLGVAKDDESAESDDGDDDHDDSDSDSD